MWRVVFLLKPIWFLFSFTYWQWICSTSLAHQALYVVGFFGFFLFAHLLQQEWQKNCLGSWDHTPKQMGQAAFLETLLKQPHIPALPWRSQPCLEDTWTLNWPGFPISCHPTHDFSTITSPQGGWEDWCILSVLAVSGFVVVWYQPNARYMNYLFSVFTSGHQGWTAWIYGRFIYSFAAFQQLLGKINHYPKQKITELRAWERRSAGSSQWN